MARENGSSDYQNMEPMRLENILIAVQAFKEEFVLCAAFLFKPGITDDDDGHYVAAVRDNNKFLVYDDTKKDVKNIAADKNILIDSLLYLRVQK